jgi:hypothetical protein
MTGAMQVSFLKSIATEAAAIMIASVTRRLTTLGDYRFAPASIWEDTPD